ncbi:MAG: AbrB/MazE/SpoVT family DNA-binding domain-containing protein, partial [Microcystis panniformis]
MKLKICKIGNSLGASFPKEVLDKLQVGEGDTIYVTETPDGVQLTTYDPEFEQIMEAASQV